ncbi:cytochrome c biogenesis protein CcdA [Flammeovirgaceae bacterium SG7u.111]|nr:cytochrome c biogenesis protein CcdA [Flammeovirgaceae bacterium SG7u.132]WPO35880.1 cytochrome c biogenesis protein CcdA [Flammeovirgaceae bacterium SG7u.111]
MRQTVFLLFLVLLTASKGFAQFDLPNQILEPATWDSNISTKEAQVGETVELVFTASIIKDWYLYSSDFDPDLGPMVTEFSFEPNDSYELVGGITPINPSKKFDEEIWGGEYTYFKGEGVFKQKVKVLSKNFSVKASVSYQVCSDIDGKCIPASEDFTFNKLKVGNGGDETPAPEEKLEKITPEPKEVKEDQVVVPGDSGEAIESIEEAQEFSADMSEEGESVWGFMVIAFLGGLAAILTPCVFPMVPMTVSFFNKPNQPKAKNIFQALTYGISIILIYTVIGAIVAKIFGPAAANFLSTHWLPNLLFFAIFFIFALSFFGMFEIVLPSKLVNSMDRQADKGGVLAPFFMAFTLVLVSFSCTGPIVGSILVESAGGAFVKPVAGMFAFSLAFAIPFTFLAFFPSWLSKMPKSGGWMNSVKVVLGFVELALAFKFLSVADQVYHWGILDRYVYIAIWAAIALSLGLYLLGYIRLPHDSKLEIVPIPRMLLAVVSFTFVIYLLPGLFGAPLKLLSGYLPPQTTHEFDLVKTIRENAGSSSTSQSNVTTASNYSKRKYADKLHFPHGIQGYFDLEEGMAAAKAEGKPIFIDFTGHGCVNCRKMEDNVWGETPVLKRLKNEYVVVALYVDDRTLLPESEWVTSSYDGKVKKTLGEVNADWQISKFKNNAQPFYLLLDHKGELLAKPKAFDLEVQNFVDFLDSGLKEFETRQKQLAVK